MSTVAQLEALLSRIQKNRGVPRVTSRTSSPGSIPAPRIPHSLDGISTSDPLPLEIEIDGPASVLPPPGLVSAPPPPLQPAPSRPIAAAPATVPPPPAPSAPPPAPMMTAQVTAAVSAAPVAAPPSEPPPPRVIARGSVGPPSSPVARAVVASRNFERPTFRTLLARSLALRPRG